MYKFSPKSLRKELDGKLLIIIFLDYISDYLNTIKNNYIARLLQVKIEMFFFRSPRTIGRNLTETSCIEHNQNYLFANQIFETIRTISWQTD